MQTLLLDNAKKQEHRLDGFTGITLGHDPSKAFVVTGVVGADNATQSYPDAMMFLPTGGRPCFTQVGYNKTPVRCASALMLRAILPPELCFSWAM